MVILNFQRVFIEYKFFDIFLVFKLIILSILKKNLSIYEEEVINLF